MKKVLFFLFLFCLSNCANNRKSFSIYGINSTIIINDVNDIAKLQCFLMNDKTLIKIEFYPIKKIMWYGFLRMSVENEPQIEYIPIDNIEECKTIINSFNKN